MSRAIWIVFAPLVALAGCYGPHPVNGGFKCSADNQFACPAGLTCDRNAGLCLSGPADLAGPVMDLAFTVDAGPPAGRTCDERVRQGAFSNLTNLTAANTAGDESSLSVTSDGKHLYFMNGGQVWTASATGKSAGAPAAVTIANAPAVINGGSILSNGNFWFAGSAVAAGPSALYNSAPDITGTFIATAQALPVTASCSFFDPVFLNGTSSSELYVSYPLAGCSGPSYIARGANNKQIGAFYAAVPLPPTQAGLRYATLTPSGLTLLFSTTGASPRLNFAVRASTDSVNDDTSWNGPTPLPLSGLGTPSGGDWQAVITADCSTLYLVADRAGGHGGADLWAADIAQE